MKEDKEEGHVSVLMLEPLKVVVNWHTHPKLCSTVLLWFNELNTHTGGFNHQVDYTLSEATVTKSSLTIITDPEHILSWP